ncbi:hypothetical protein AB0D38_47500, partial [Streptomyces sp. NPDC048279]
MHLNTPESTGRAQAAYGVSFTDALDTRALVGGIGILVAAVVAVTLMASARTAPRRPWRRRRNIPPGRELTSTAKRP